MSSSIKDIEPDLHFIKPDKAFNNVLFPDPLGPIIAVRLPRSICTDMSFKITFSFISTVICSPFKIFITTLSLIKTKRKEHQ